MAIRKIWLGMSLFLRILTLLTFAAHAVLGCCLSHGSCTDDPSRSHVETCCGHSHPTQDGHEACEAEPDAPSECRSEPDTTTSPAYLHGSSDGDGGSGPCDHSRCVFDIAVRSLVVLDWKASADIGWLGPFFDGRLVPFSEVSARTVGAQGPPKPLTSRASLQVWLI